MRDGSNYRPPVIDIDAQDVYGAPNQTGTPERNLLMAILERAILDFVGNDQKEVKMAEAWLFEGDEENSERKKGFSFPWICEQLDLNHQEIGATVKALPKRGKHRIAPWYFTKCHRQSA